jgi:hypothetical protein
VTIHIAFSKEAFLRPSYAKAQLAFSRVPQSEPVVSLDQYFSSGSS